MDALAPLGGGGYWWDIVTVLRLQFSQCSRSNGLGSEY